MKIRISLLNTDLEALQKELIELKEHRLEGEGISVSENQDKSIVGNHDDRSFHSETEEDLIKRIIQENDKLMANPATIENLIDQYAQQQEPQLSVLPVTSKLEEKLVLAPLEEDQVNRLRKKKRLKLMNFQHRILH